MFTDRSTVQRPPKIKPRAQSDGATRREHSRDDRPSQPSNAERRPQQNQIMRSICRTRASSSPPAVAVAVGSGALLPVFLLSAAASTSTFVLAANSVEHRHRRNDDNRNGNLQHGPAMHVLRGGDSMTRRQLKRKRLVAHSSAHHPSHIRHNENDAKVAAAAVADSEPTSRNDS